MLEFDRGTLSFDEDPIKHTFIAKNDIAETIAERELTKLKPQTTYNLVKKIKASKIYEKFLVCEMEQFKIQWSKVSELQ